MNSLKIRNRGKWRLDTEVVKPSSFTSTKPFLEVPIFDRNNEQMKRLKVKKKSKIKSPEISQMKNGLIVIKISTMYFYISDRKLT